MALLPNVELLTNRSLSTWGLAVGFLRRLRVPAIEGGNCGLEPGGLSVERGRASHDGDERPLRINCRPRSPFRGGSPVQFVYA